MITTAAKLVLGPLLIWQGRRVRDTALRLPEPEGPRRGQAGEGLPTLRLLIVGDSSGAGVGASHQGQALAMQLAATLALNRGNAVSWQVVAQSGLRSDQALALLESALIDPADVLITALGVNDVVDQQASSACLAALDRIHRLARERAGVRLSLHCAAPPMHAFPLLPQPLRWFFGRQASQLNASLRMALSGGGGRHLVELPEAMRLNAPALIAEDGFHPNPEGYRLWAAHLAEVIAAQLDSPNTRGLP